MLNLHVFRTREITKLILHFLRQKLLCEKVQRIIGTNICHSNIENIFSVVLCLRQGRHKNRPIITPKKVQYENWRCIFTPVWAIFPYIYFLLFYKKCRFWASVTRAPCLLGKGMNACLVALCQKKTFTLILLVRELVRKWESLSKNGQKSIMNSG